MKPASRAWIACLLWVGCGYGTPVRLVRAPSTPIHVRVANPQIPSSTGPGTWVNSCEQVARLGSNETRVAWLGRVERVVEDRNDQLASITYPPGDGVDVALVCFSTHAD
jgi:hypothetical protein